MLAKKLLLLFLFLGCLSAATASDIGALQEELEIAEYDPSLSQQELSTLIAIILENLNQEDLETLADFKALLVRAFYLRATRYPSAEVFVDVLEAVNIEQELKEERLVIGNAHALSNADMAAIYLAQARYHRSNGEPRAALVALNDGLRLVPNNPSILQERAFLYREMGERELSEKDKNTVMSLASSRRARANDRAYIFVLLAELAETPEEKLLYTQQARVSVEASGVFKFDMASIEPRLNRLEEELGLVAKASKPARPIIAEEIPLLPSPVEEIEEAMEEIEEAMEEIETNLEADVSQASLLVETSRVVIAPQIVTPADDLEQGIKAQELIEIMQRGVPSAGSQTP